MFEYTALVDAPVQRFTGIVTGAEPDDESITVVVRAAAVPMGVVVTEAPLLLVAVEPEPVEPELVEPKVVEPQLVEPASLPATPVAPVQPVVRRTFAPRPDRPPSASGSLVPALLAIAAAGATAMWWLRRDSHDGHR